MDYDPFAESWITTVKEFMMLPRVIVVTSVWDPWMSPKHYLLRKGEFFCKARASWMPEIFSWFPCVFEYHSNEVADTDIYLKETVKE